MVKIKKLLDDIFPELIDLFYGIQVIFLNYYQIFVGLVGLFYLSDNIQSNILKKIWGEVPHEFLGAEFQKGTFSQAVMSFFFLYITFKLIVCILSSASKKEKRHTILEILVGSVLVTIGIQSDPVVTPDKILIFIGWFMLLKLELIIITRVFKISTRHFGSIKTEVIYLEFPVLGNKEKKEAGSSE